jgi:hypothetical protein
MKEHVVSAGARGAAAVLLVLVAAVSLDRALRLRYDFHHFYLDARRVWTHGVLEFETPTTQPETQRQLPFYLPAVPVLLAPLTAGGQVSAAVLWTLAQVGALAYCLLVLWRWRAADGDTQSAAKDFVLLLVLAAYALYEAARFNQLSFFVLALILAGVGSWERRRPWAGVWLAAATVLKLLPAVFVVWLMLKRAWRALAAYVVAMTVLSAAPCLIAFGPARTVAYHRQWWDYNVAGMLATGPDAHKLQGHFRDHRNQSILAVVGRLCERGHPYAVTHPLLSLDEAAARRLAQLISAGLALALVWSTRASPARRSIPALRAEISVYLLAMLVFSPLLRQYYLVWALPALLSLMLGARGARTGAARTLAWAGVVTWVVGQVAWLSETARAYGVHLVMLVVMGALLLACRAREEPASSDAQSAMA